jgi:hypothetical protein
MAHQAPVELIDRFMEGATDQHDWPWAVTVWAKPIRALLEAIDEDLSQLAADTTPLVRPLPPTAAVIDVDAAPVVNDMTMPNVLGMIEGSDPALQREYLVLSAHFDTRGTAADRADNAAGTAALLAVAKAFSQSGMRPRRSVVFLATSGKAPSFEGANYFAHVPSLPARYQGRPAMNLTLDIGSGVVGDSVIVDGSQDVALASPPGWTAAEHPELGLRVVDGGTAVMPKSDHFAFARVAIPSLYFHAGESREGMGSVPDVIRIARFVFYVMAAVADTDQRPQWTAAGREQLRPVLLP